MSSLFFGIKCHQCGFIGSSEEAAGGGALADTGDFDELRCPKCEWVTLHEDPSESDLCDEIVRLRTRIAELERLSASQSEAMDMMDRGAL